MNKTNISSSKSSAIKGILQGEKHLHKSLVKNNDNPSSRYCYGVGHIFQLSRTEAFILAGKHVEKAPAVDFAGGTDIIVFDDINEIDVAEAMPFSKNQEGINSLNGEASIFLKYPMNGGFVPLGARNTGGAHPHAGTGFALSTVISFPKTGLKNEDERFKWAHRPDLYRYFELTQFSYDGKEIKRDKTEQIQRNELLPEWLVTGCSLSCAIPDGNDLLFPMLCSKNENANHEAGGLSGISRWIKKSSGWYPVSFTPVTPDIESYEPTLARAGDGTLVFCTRPSWRDNCCFDILVWTSRDGVDWVKVIHEKKSGPVRL